MNKKQMNKCAKCGEIIEQCTTFLRRKDGSAIHAKGDYCHAKKELDQAKDAINNR